MPSLNTGKFWGPQRLVEVWREPDQALGIAIVGGKVDLTGGRNLGRSEEKYGDRGETLTGIFIKNVIKDSPTGRTGQLATGDRIVQVCERDILPMVFI